MFFFYFGCNLFDFYDLFDIISTKLFFAPKPKKKSESLYWALSSNYAENGPLEEKFIIFLVCAEEKQCFVSSCFA